MENLISSPEIYSHPCLLQETMTHKQFITPLKSVGSGKYLGVTLNNKLNYAEFISNIRTKSYNTLGFLLRNLQGCRSDVKSTTYSIMVRPTLSMQLHNRNPYQQSQIQLLDSVQRRAARYVKVKYHERTPDCNINDRGSTAGVLQIRRLRSRLVIILRSAMTW